jgi:DMSO/TMAO reductase YedYZ molybdopterin-dependent catalytic subunit
MRPDRRAAALSGLAAVAAALGAAELVALLTGPLTAPVVAVGGVVIDVVPEPVKHFAITLFGVHDKLALQIGTLALLAAGGAGVGLVARRWGWPPALAGVALFTALGVLAAVTRHEAGGAAAVPTLIGGAVAALVLRLLLFPARHAEPITRAEPAEPITRAEPAEPITRAEPAEPITRAEPGKTAAPVDSAGAGEPAGRPEPLGEPALPQRRRILLAAAAVLGAGAATAFAGHWFATRRTVSKERAAVRLPAPASPAPQLPADVDARLPRLAPFVTPNSDFYLIDTALVVPQVTPDEWRLHIRGRVRNPLTLTYDQLLSRSMIERYVTLCCVSNEVGGGLVGNARWLGVRVADLLAEADPEPGADQVVSRSVDGFTAGTPTAVLRDGRDAMLAVGMNGVPLPIEHGFPVRMVVPGLYGYVSATKWLTELELTSFADFDAYWIRRGWARKAPVKLQSRIDTPGASMKLRAGPVVIGGVAWAQHVGVSAVEVRVGDGAWQQARLAAVPSVDTWRQWTLPWDATPGEHRLTVRAYDTAGVMQIQDERPVLPDGATGWHSVAVTVG